MMKKGMTRRELQVTDIKEIQSILDECKVLHLGLVDGDEPYVVAMNYGYTLEDEKLTIYLHAATKGYKLDVMEKNPKVFFEMDCDIIPFEGEKACQYGIAYKSIMGKGLAEMVEDVEEKKKAMSALMKTQTGKDFIFDDRMVSIVAVIKIQASEYTAKCRMLPAAMRSQE